MPRLLSVNVGLPRDIAWKGRTVHTGIWKSSITGRVRARRLNLDGDGQGDLNGHGGEHRAVFVYQIDSYHYWREQLHRDDFVYGQFGENFTIEGLPDDAVCIGDRYEVGSALFEVTQSRVTCYRVGIRMNEPRMAALLTSSGRPGFYFRVLREGDVGAGDEIRKVAEGPERMTVSQTNALLYFHDHPRDQLERALRIPALPTGWRNSFTELLANPAPAGSTGNAGLAPASAGHPAAPGFQSLAVSAIDHESADVLSITLQATDAQPLPAALPGQFVIVRLHPDAGGATLFRSYSLSGPLSTSNYRISVKVEPHGVAGNFLRDHLRVGDRLEISAPRGNFVLQEGTRPVVLLSAGIGATPVMAMLHALAAAHSTQQILWLHAARDGQHHPFATEARALLRQLPSARSYVCYSQPAAADKPGENFDAAGRFSPSVLGALKIPPDANVYMCGPNSFMDDMKTALAATGIAPANIHTEIFNGGESRTPGVVHAAAKTPHALAGDASTGTLVSFARSGVSAHWNPARFLSILELAEACDVPVRWACRTGVCHNCESGLVQGDVKYDPQPLGAPAQGNLLICCSQPTTDLVVDL